MPCIPLPIPTVPSLPSPFTLGITTPPIHFNPQFCCKIPPIVNLPPLPIGITVNPAIIATLNAAIAEVNNYLHSLPLDCPRELQEALTG